MKKKRLIVALFISVVFALLAGVLMPDSRVYRHGKIKVSIEVSVDRDSTIRTYYIPQDNLGWSENWCISTEVKSSEGIKNIDMVLPTDELYGLRLSCDDSIDKMVVKNITIDTKTEKKVLDTDTIASFDTNDMTLVKKQDSVDFLVNGYDPYIYTNEQYKVPVDTSINYRYVIMAFVFLFLFIIIYRNYQIIIDMVFGVYQARKQIKSLAVSDFKSRFSGSYLGTFWGVIQPIMTILLFWFVFQVGFKSRPMSNAPFVCWLVAGMIPWNFFSDAWLSGNGAFIGYSYIVKKVVFNIDILPIVKIIASSIMNIIYNLIIIGVYALYGRIPIIHIIDMVYFSFCLMAFALGLSMITSALNVFIRDIGQFLNIVMQFLMWLTPIMWDYHMLTGKWSWFYKLNPLFYVINGYRDALIDKKWFFTNYYGMILFWTVTVLVNIIGIKLIRKLKPHFADVL